MAILEPTFRPPLGLPGDAPRRWKWTGDDLIRMGEAGLLPPEGRFELLAGEVYQLMPPKPLHAFIVNLIRRLLEGVATGQGGHVRQQDPIRLNEEYDPQPDLVVVRGREHDYRDRFPGPADVLLLVEVSDSSLEHDRTLKLPAYAAAGIPECWIVNLVDLVIEIYRDAAGGEYRERRIMRPGDFITLLLAPDAALAVSELLGQTAPEV